MHHDSRKNNFKRGDNDSKFGIIITCIVLPISLFLIGVSHLHSASEYFIIDKSISPVKQSSKTISSGHDNEAIINDDGNSNDSRGKLYSDDGDENKNFLRATIEITALLGIGNIIYYLNGKVNSEDYLYSRKETWKKRANGDALGFDKNPFNTNMLAHPPVGGLYFFAARRNGFNFFESLLFATVSAAAWEYLCEFREVVSINDLVITPLGGAPIGESVYQFARIFTASNSETSEFISDWLLLGRGKYHGHLDSRGLPSGLWRNMPFYFGTRNSYANDTMLHIGLKLEVFNIRNFNKSGRLNGFFFNSPYSMIEIEVNFGEYGYKEYRGFFEASLIAYGSQRIRTSGTGNTGYAFFAGLNSAYEYETYSMESFEDMLGICHVIGPSLDFFLSVNDFRFRIKIAAFGDLSAVKSFGYDEFEKTTTRSNVRYERREILLAEHQYYYAYGATGKGLFSARYKAIEAGIETSYMHFRSLNQAVYYRENDHPPSTSPVHSRDTRIKARGWIACNIVSDVSLKTAVMKRYAAGETDGIKRSAQSDTMYDISVTYNH